MTYNASFVNLISDLLSPLQYRRKGILFYKFEPEKKLLKYVTFEMLWGKRTFRILTCVDSMLDPCLVVRNRFHAAMDDHAFDIGLYLYMNKHLPEKAMIFNNRYEPYEIDGFTQQMQKNIDIYMPFIHEMEKVDNLSDLYDFRNRVEPFPFQLRLAIYLGYLEDAKSIIGKQIQVYCEEINKLESKENLADSGKATLQRYKTSLGEGMNYQREISTGCLEERIRGIESSIESNIQSYSEFFK